MRHYNLKFWLCPTDRHREQVRVAQKTRSCSEPPTFLIYREVGCVMHKNEILWNLNNSLGSRPAIFQNGRQNGGQNRFFFIYALLVDKTWLVICPFLGFRGLGIQICQNWLRQKIQYGGNPRWRPKWRLKSRFSLLFVPMVKNMACNMSKPRFSGSRNSNVTISTS